MTTNSLRGVAIGSTVGLAAGAVVSLVLLARSRHFYMPIGSPLDMVLPQAVTLAQGQRADAGGGQGALLIAQ
jgi:dolichol kinase